MSKNSPAVDQATSRIPIVAIGASAGGLKQISALLEALPEDTGAAFVVVQHLSSEHISQLPELLARATRLEVISVEDGTRARPNCIHVMPEDTALEIEGDTFVFVPKTHEPGPTVIDHFMRSLASARGPQAVGIILSGTGSDGALGLKALKRCGGLALVQDPSTAEHPGMPRAAINSASPDYVLATTELVAPLCNHLAHNMTDSGPAFEDQEPEESVLEDATLRRALRVLANADDKRDFSQYKAGMLKRRLQRRIGLVGVKDEDRYIHRLQDNSDERRALAQDFLISVTDFFRDTDAFGVLCERVFPQLLADRNASDPVRVWVPGCATGEEAYSMAMALDEAIEASSQAHQFIVFASDIDARALEVARLGLYPETIAAEVSKPRLRRYFERHGDEYRIKRSLREQVVFATQNLTEDPPYARLDLISCRNLLMYLRPEAQKQVIATFHFALKPQGTLFLGSAETLSGQINLFESFDKNARLFTRIGASHGTTRHELPFAAYGGRKRSGEEMSPENQSQHENPEHIARDLLLREFVPASVLINRKYEILCSYGETRDFLNLPFGASSLSLVDMVRDGYRSHTRAATHRAFRDDTSAEIVATVPAYGDHPIRITARPLHKPESARGLAFVTFERIQRGLPADTPAANTENERQLVDDLAAVRSELNTTIQSLEASNEDLNGSNEEVLSMNEELRSTNEELQTSKEELQSVNEELSTVNSELESKVAELETAHNDLQNLFAGGRVATLFLDRGLCIKRFTPTITDLLSLIMSDIGRPLSDISLKFDDPDLEADAEHTMADLTHRDKEVRASNGRWYQRRILPYRTQNNTIDGVVITFSDITALKQSATVSAESEQRLDLAMGAFRGGMWDMYLGANAEGSRPDHVYLSARLKQLLGFADDQFPNSMRAWEERVIEEDRAAFRDIDRRQQVGASGLHYRIRHRDGSIRWFASYGMQAEDGAGGMTRWVGIDRDITERKLTDIDADQARARLRLLADAVSEMIAYVNAEGIFQFGNGLFNECFGHACGGIAGRSLAQVLDTGANAALQPCLEAALAGRSSSCQFEQIGPDVQPQKLAANLVPQTVGGKTIGAYLLVTRIGTQGRRASDQIDRQRGMVYLQRLATIGKMTASLAHDIKQPLTAINNYASALKRMVHVGQDEAALISALDKIADQVRHASDMVSLTRDFGRERDTDDSDADLNTLVQRAVSLTENLAHRHRIEVHTDLQRPLPVLECLSIQIEQVIINLIVNAVDAMADSDTGDRHLTLRTRPFDEHGVELSVEDTGSGIPPEKLKRIFDTFYTSKLEGTGLGLSMSRAIVEAHGGRIWADSRLDHGATFVIELPGKTAS
jgi:two-component system CheB/CheR fusion protein